MILVGKLLARTAVRTIEHVTLLPAYGAEVRGGTSHCQIVLSSDPISSPVNETFDSMIIMNQASGDRFGSALDDGGSLVVNTSLCKAMPAAAALLPATDMASELGDVRVANVIMLGALLSRRPLVPPGSIEDEIRTVLEGREASLVDLNLKAYRIGSNA